MRSSVSIRALHYFAIFLTLLMNACAGSNLAPTTAAAPESGHTATSDATTVGPHFIVPSTSGRFGLIQVSDAYGRPGTGMTITQIMQEAPHYDSVWATFFPATWSTYHPSMIVTRYYLPNEDAYLMSGHNPAWFLANHPDWILYGCDNFNNPTTHYAWGDTQFPYDVPLNIHNPSAVVYQMANILAYLQANHYNALAVDNVVFKNYLRSPNPILEGSSNGPKAGWYGCGYYSQGPGVPSSFVRVYNAPSNNDTTWIGDIENWIAQAKATLHPHGIRVIVNHPPFGSTPNANEFQMLGNIDAMLDENGYTHYGKLLYQAGFANTLSWVTYLQSHSIVALMADYFCYGSTCSNLPSSLTAQQVDWALGSYAIGNNGAEDAYISPHGGAIYTYRPEYSKTYGAACSAAYTQLAPYIYERKFQGALVIVNASGTGNPSVPPTGASYSLTLPHAVNDYADIEGRAISNPLTVLASDAYVLLTSNGCT